MHDRLLENWNAVDAITLQFLDNIPESIFHSRSFADRFTSFAWEFTCIFTTREMYIDGFTTGRLDGNSKQSDEKFIAGLTKLELKERLNDVGSKIRGIIVDKPTEINYFGSNWSTRDVISYLLQHEQLHFGKLMLFCAQADIEVPTLLKDMWGMASFAKQ